MHCPRDPHYKQTVVFIIIITHLLTGKMKLRGFLSNMIQIWLLLLLHPILSQIDHATLCGIPKNKEGNTSSLFSTVNAEAIQRSELHFEWKNMQNTLSITTNKTV